MKNDSNLLVLFVCLKDVLSLVTFDWGKYIKRELFETEVKDRYEKKRMMEIHAYKKVEVACKFPCPCAVSHGRCSGHYWWDFIHQHIWFSFPLTYIIIISSHFTHPKSPFIHSYVSEFKYHNKILGSSLFTIIHLNVIVTHFKPIPFLNSFSVTYF